MERPQLPPTDGNPILALVTAVIYALLYVLQGIRWLATFMTLTVPGWIVRALQYSFTISLGFYSLSALFVAGIVASSFFVRYKYLNTYADLKDNPLPPPSPTSLPHLPESILTESLTSSRSSNPFHNYLDDFLSAIRIFGFLEKPVFHELSRHLQTRRLGAGETLEVGGGEFWCVVEGHVQVFAPSSDAAAGEDPTSYNGYHLLNEVGTGGTLSSLFSILSLFTEDIQLEWDASSPQSPEEDVDTDTDTELVDTGRPFTKRRTNSDVSHLDFGMRAETPEALSPANGPSSDLSASPNFRRDSASESLTSQTTLMPPSSQTLEETEDQKSPSPPAPATQLQDFLATSSLPPTVLSSPALRAVNEETAHSSPAQKPSRRAKPKRTAPPPPVSALEGTIARATVDTTLAVIPAEAFKKLTRKFPKASGSIVQVVLERFSRVTFMTAHKYLGLTREVLKSESALNRLVSHPLPRSFYTSGGMQALRERFQPEVRAGKVTPGGPSRRASREEEKDYFNLAPSTPGTAKAPSLPSVTPRGGNTPMIPQSKPKQTLSTSIASAASLSITKINSPVSVPKTGNATTPAVFSPNAAFIRRTSAMRKQVGAGDLAMSNMSGAGEGPYYRPKAQTPSLARMDTWRGRVNSGNFGKKVKGDLPEATASDTEGDETFDLREAVMLSIAKSIGLVQPPQNVANPSASASASAFSTPNSPMFPPASSRSGRQAPFGNVLDMMNASRSSEGVIGGMMRESLFSGTQSAGDDESSVHESMGGIANPRAVLAEMQGKVEILYFTKGKPLVKEGEKAAGLYYVIDGFLDVSISGHSTQSVTPVQSHTASTSQSSDSPKTPFGSALGMGMQEDALLLPPAHPAAKPDETLFTVKPGGIAGYLSSLCSTDSYVNITAKTDCFVGFLPHSALERILERKPIVLLTLAKRLLSLLSPLILHIDAALDWQQLDAGKVLYRKGDKSRDFFIVINGRLRSLDEKESSVEVVREYGQGDSIGELDVITAAHRPDTLHAIRDSELVRIPGALFDAISIKHPVTTIQFLRLIASRVRKAVNEKAPPPATTVAGGSNISRSNLNLKTVCILGATRNVPVAAFATKLKSSLEELGASTSYLDQSSVMRQLGRHAFSRIGKLKVAGWLADQEQRYRTVLYVADTPVSSQWTLTSIRQADLVLIVAMGDDPSLGEYEKLLLATKTTARKELVLLHDDRHVAPGSTRQWLRNRPWCHAHHHVELPGVVIPTKAVPVVHDPAAVAAFKHLREKVEGRIKKYRGLRPLGRPRRPPHMNDFARIARRLCGKSIGVVLGGGGARGISHIGMLQALEELGIPVDSIGGCSIGAFVGGLYARTTDLLETTGRTKQFSGRMGSVLRLLSDVTYPFVAYTTGHEFNRGIYKAFYDTHIEDFWIPFFANSTNITHSRMEIHRTGYAWRYVRASMTLAGLLPPLSDSGNLLVDGGYIDNIPANALKSLGVQDIIAVDVGSVDDTSPRVYGDSVSGWWIFLNRFNPFSENRVLSMTEVSSRLTYVSSARSLEEVKNTPGCLYMSMPVQQFETLGGFNQFSDVLAVGLEAARKQLGEWKEQGKLPTGLVDEVKGAKAIQRGNRLRRMSI